MLCYKLLVLTWRGHLSVVCFLFQEVMAVYLAFTPNCHNLTGDQYDWTHAAAAIDTHRKREPVPSDWLTYHMVAVIVAPCMDMRALSLTGASGLARLLFLRNRNVHRVLPQTHTLPPLLLSVCTRWMPAAAPHIYTSHPQPTI